MHIYIIRTAVNILKYRLSFYLCLIVHLA